ncbi:hypothetical protein BKA93DRAFT_796452 [Sparassis latifolia]
MICMRSQGKLVRSKSNSIHLLKATTCQLTSGSSPTNKKKGSPDDTSRYCNSKVITSQCCKQSTENKGGKN